VKRWMRINFGVVFQLYSSMKKDHHTINCCEKNNTFCWFVLLLFVLFVLFVSIKHTVVFLTSTKSESESESESATTKKSNKNMSEFSVVWITVPNQEVAKSLFFVVVVVVEIFYALLSLSPSHSLPHEKQKIFI
jgi:hypothetical protein